MGERESKMEKRKTKWKDRENGREGKQNGVKDKYMECWGKWERWKQNGEKEK